MAEMITDPEQKITRPRQIFVGQPRRELRNKRLSNATT